MHGAGWYSVEAVKLLLAHEASVNLVDSEGNSALIHACSLGDTFCVFGNDDEYKADYEKVALALIAAKADVSIANAAGETALIWASAFGLAGAVRALLAAKADVHHTANDGDTALSRAHDNGKEEVEGVLTAHIAQLAEQAREQARVDACLARQAAVASAAATASATAAAASKRKRG
jgi:ankyrin repeat protein